MSRTHSPDLTKKPYFWSSSHRCGKTLFRNVVLRYVYSGNIHLVCSGKQPDGRDIIQMKPFSLDHIPPVRRLLNNDTQGINSLPARPLLLRGYRTSGVSALQSEYRSSPRNPTKPHEWLPLPEGSNAPLLAEVHPAPPSLLCW